MVKRVLAAAAAVLLAGTVAHANNGMWLTDAELAALPTSGTAWGNVTGQALDCGTYVINNQDSNTNVCYLANALVCGRCAAGSTTWCTTNASVVTTACTRALRGINQFINQATGQASGGQTACTSSGGCYSTSGEGLLALGREGQTAPIIADLISLPTRDSAANARFVLALKAALAKTGIPGNSGTGKCDALAGSIKNCSCERPNNHGAMCMAARVAWNIYLGADGAADLAKAANWMKIGFGETNDPNYMDYKTGGIPYVNGLPTQEDWQANCPNYSGSPCRAANDSANQLCETAANQADTSKRCYWINPQGATRDGKIIDGVIPDDQRRAGGFTWPPPNEDYVYEDLQGMTVAAMLLHRHNPTSYPAMDWGDQAIKRAYLWEMSTCVSGTCKYRGGSCTTDETCGNNFPPTGDDAWTLWMPNYWYGTAFPASTSTGHGGKGMGYTDWTHASSRAPCPACANGIKDCGEADIDCGASATGCSRCANGDTCTNNNECSSTYCLSGVCGTTTTTTLPGIPTTTLPSDTTGAICTGCICQGCIMR